MNTCADVIGMYFYTKCDAVIEVLQMGLYQRAAWISVCPSVHPSLVSCTDISMPALLGRERLYVLLEVTISLKIYFRRLTYDAAAADDDDSDNDDDSL